MQSEPGQAMMEWLSGTFPQARMLDDVTLSRFVSLHTDLPRYNLCYLGDRAEMANGLEARLPFLDSRVADLLWRMPSAFHRSNGEGKRVLRAMLARRLPKAAARPKRNFLTPAAPSGNLLRGPLAERWLSTAAIRRAGIFGRSRWRRCAARQGQPHQPVDGVLPRRMPDHGAVCASHHRHVLRTFLRRLWRAGRRCRWSDLRARLAVVNRRRGRSLDGFTAPRFLSRHGRWPQQRGHEGEDAEQRHRHAGQQHDAHAGGAEVAGDVRGWRRTSRW